MVGFKKKSLGTAKRCAGYNIRQWIKIRERGYRPIVSTLFQRGCSTKLLCSGKRFSQALNPGLAILLLCANPVQANIYRCIQPGGQLLYTDRPCPDAQPLTMPGPPTTRFTPIAADDLKRLAKAQRRETQRRVAARKTRVAKYQHDQAQSVRRARQCQTATSKLKQLATQRRRGYSSRTERRLDEAQRRLKLSKQRNC